VAYSIATNVSDIFRTGTSSTIYLKTVQKGPMGQ